MGTIKFKVERVDPTGNVLVNSVMDISTGSDERKHLDRFILTIGEHQYFVKENGEIVGQVKNRQFTLTDKEEKDIKEWQEHIKAIYGGYGSYEYRFVPTEIGSCVFVKSNLAGIEKDFTDIDSW